MNLICFYSNAFISTLAKYYVQTYILNIQSFEVVFSFLPNKLPPKVYPIEGDSTPVNAYP